MRKLTKVEILRKVVHLSSLIYPILYLTLADQNLMLSITGLLLTLILTIEFMRMKSTRINSIFCKFFGFSLRQKEENHLTGAAFFMIGTFLTILCFNKEIAVLALFVLVISDTFASIIGLSYGNTKILDDKTLEGSFGFFISAGIISFIASKYISIPLEHLLVASAFSTILELIKK